MPASPSPEEALFRAASELPPGATRRVFLDQACAGDAALRQRLETLLAAHEAPDDLLATAEPKARATMKVEFPDDRPDEAVGQTIGRYKLLERIGEGGCGVVYVAEQTEPIRRRVALKVIKLGMDTKQVVARFEAERQALAMMDHPNIAKVLDAGTTEAVVEDVQGRARHSVRTGAEQSEGGAQRTDAPYLSAGRPYFVMELVRGIKITDYCDQANLSTKERLDLFHKVCQAIQHAHQKGIIHRDIKPSNILVTLHDGVPVPKVIDFGIAKATEGRLTDHTVYTQLHQFIGTPAYMSPEQAEMSGLDIDTRSDIYSLGVLLYELLAGSTPFDPKDLVASGIDAMRKTIREQEPVRPSTRLATLKGEDLTTTAKRRSSEAPKLIHLLKGDLDWIVMKCLEKDRTRRYETANGLAADLKRHLNNEPVVARPPSTAYRFQKAFRRNKLMFAAGTAVVIALVVGLGLAAAGLRQALAEKSNAQAALHFIQDDVLSQASPGHQPDRDLKVRTLLDRVADRLDRTTGRPPLVEASIRQTVGSVYTELGDYAKAVLHYEGALRLQRQQLSEGHPDVLRSLYGLAMARWWSGDMAKAEPLTRQGLEASRRALGERDPLTLQFMQARAFVILFAGELPWTELDPFFHKTLALHLEVLGPDDSGTLRLIYGLGLGYAFNWEEAKALPHIENALDRSRALGEQNPHTGALTALLAYLYSQLNQLEKAEPLALRSVELRRNILTEQHPLTISSMLVLARIYIHQKQSDKARQLTDHALDLCRRLSIENSLFLAGNLSSLGWEYLEQGDVGKAETLCEMALDSLRRKPDANSLANSRILTHMGAVRLAQREYVEAEQLLREGATLVEKHSPDAAYRFYGLSLLGASLAGQQKFGDAELLLLQGYEGLEQRRASIPDYLNPARRIHESLKQLVQLYDDWDKPGPATEWRQKLAGFEPAANVRDGGNTAEGREPTKHR